MNVSASNFVCLLIEASGSHCSLMVDCGSDISVIKAHKVKQSQIYFPNNKCNVTGIGSGTISTLGDTNTNILIEDVALSQNFHIVENSFPIPTDGILGRDFLCKYKCTIDYDAYLLSIKIGNNIITVPITNQLGGNYIIPPRCEIIKRINLQNIEESVTIAEEIQPGVFCANGIVDTHHKYMKIINTTDETKHISCKFTPKLVPLSNYVIQTSNKRTQKDNTRNETLMKEINLDPGVDPKIKPKLEKLCEEFNDIFALKDDVLSVNNFYEQKISLQDSRPVYIKNYRMPESQKEEINSQIKRMLDDGIIQHSTSPYNNPILLVPKKSDGEKKWRLVIDFRQLNKNISPDKFPLPRIDEILDQLGRAKYFSTLDLMAGFHQIPLTNESKKYTAFSSSKGHFEFNRLPFGLNISPNSFQRMMSIALCGLPPQCAFLYIDDIIVIGCSISHHFSNLREVFQCLRKYNLKLNPSKCHFFKSEVTYLGHHVSNMGIQPDKSKFLIIEKYPVPKNVDETRRFVAFCNYYRRFIPNFANICYPLNKLLRKNIKFEWSPECQIAFDFLKKSLLSPNILQFPDFQKQFILTTDASKVACGAVLAQVHDGVEKPIAFASKAFTKGESHKSTIEQELTAIHWAVLHFRPYLYGRKFVIKTDHRPLVYLFSLKNPTSKLTRMRCDLEEYDFSIEYIKGKSNVVADAFSRIPLDMNELKQMFAITRSMARNEQNPPVNEFQAQKTDQLHVFEALNNADAYKLPKLSFVKYSQSPLLTMILHKKNYNPRLTLALDLKWTSEKFRQNALEQIFKILEHAIPENNNPRLASHKAVNSHNENMIAIANNDTIFEYIDINEFKKIGNAILRDATIMIYERPKIVTNENDILGILNLYHENPIGGHLGTNRLYRKLKPIYTWPNMKKRINDYVKACVSCKINKHYPKVKTKFVETTTPLKAFEILSIDTIGPFTYTNKGNRYAVTLQCDLSKFLIIIPVPDKTATTIAKAIIEKCILLFGPVSSIKTDQGTEYKGVFDEVCKLLKITHTCASAYHPQTIGALERSHKTLNEYLRIFANDTRNDWDDWLPYFCFSFNTTPSVEHGYTPFELVFGKSANLFDIVRCNKIDPLYNYESYEKELKFKLQVAHSKVRDAILKEKTKRTIQLNSEIIPTPLNIGDIVYLKLENRQKLDPVNSGPFSIIELSESNAIILNNNTKQKFQVHKTRLTKFKP